MARYFPCLVSTAQWIRETLPSPCLLIMFLLIFLGDFLTPRWAHCPLLCAPVALHADIPLVCAKLLQSSPALCYPMDCSPPGSSVHGILQARILEWVAMPFSRGFSWPRALTHVSCVSCISRGSSPLAPPGKSHPSGTHHIYYTLIFCSHICLPHKILSSSDKNQECKNHACLLL